MLKGERPTDDAARLMDIDPVYTDVQVLRWHNFTEGEPVLEATGEPLSTVAEARLNG